MMCKNSSWWTCLTLIAFIIFANFKCVQLIPFQCQLCEPADIPCSKENPKTCQMKYYRLNSTECRDLAFNELSTATDNELGRVALKTYHYDLFSYKQTGFNVSVSGIQWKHFKFRFKQDGNELKNTCREFYMSNSSTLTELFYDCLWSNETYEGKSFYFEYEANNETANTYRRYLFRVPFAKNINDGVTSLANWEVFTSVEIIRNGFGLTTFILYWQPLPDVFVVNSYNITVLTNDSGSMKLLESSTVTCDEPESCRYIYNKWYGNVQFGIQPVCTNYSVDCSVSRTQIFVLGGESTKPVLIGIVSVTLVVPIILYLLFLLRNHLLYKAKKWIQSTPKLLIIYTPSVSPHCNVVFALVEYLKTCCNVQPLVDELHIFMSKSKDPFKWCNESFKSADMVMVIASPYHKYLRLTDSVYQNTDILLLRLLRERLSTRGSKTQFFTLMLPYCSEKDVQSDAINLKRFVFPDDLNKMLRFIHKEWKLPECLSPDIQGGKEDYKLFGTKLSATIEEAQVDLRKNESEYQRMIEEIRAEKDVIDSDHEMLTCIKHKKENCCEFNDHSLRNKSVLIELAEDHFKEFPGSLDGMNLLGEEESESLVNSDRTSVSNTLVDFNDLEL